MSANTEIHYLGDLQRLTIQPGDVFVLTVDQQLTMEAAAQIRATMERVLGGAKVLVLLQGMKLGALSTSHPTEDGAPTLASIDAKLSTLIEALAAEEQEEPAPATTLDGDEAGSERDQDRPL